MLPLPRWAVLAAALLFLPSAEPCNQFSISIEVVAPGGGREKTTRTDTYPAAEDPAPRPVLKAGAGRQLTVAWKAENTGDVTFSDVVVHFFVVKEDRPGQPEVPELGKDVLHEGALSMDFMPADQSTGKFTITFDESGSYLVRVETNNLVGSHGHDHFAALDVVVE